jgi:hypothetical protein
MLSFVFPAVSLQAAKPKPCPKAEDKPPYMLSSCSMLPLLPADVSLQNEKPKPCPSGRAGGSTFCHLLFDVASVHYMYYDLPLSICCLLFSLLSLCRPRSPSLLLRLRKVLYAVSQYHVLNSNAKQSLFCHCMLSHCRLRSPSLPPRRRRRQQQQQQSRRREQQAQQTTPTRSCPSQKTTTRSVLQPFSSLWCCCCCCFGERHSSRCSRRPLCIHA